MNKHHVKGSWKETKGRVQEEVGHALGRDSTATKGVIERIKGKLQKGLGNVKDAVKRSVDKVLEKRSDEKRTESL